MHRRSWSRGAAPRPDPDRIESKPEAGGITPVAVLAGASEPPGFAQSVSSLLRNALSAMPPTSLPLVEVAPR